MAIHAEGFLMYKVNLGITRIELPYMKLITYTINDNK